MIDVVTKLADATDASFRCQTCREEFDFESFAEAALKNFFADANFHNVKDGGEPVIVECPGCDKEGWFSSSCALGACQPQGRLPRGRPPTGTTLTVKGAG